MIDLTCDRCVLAAQVAETDVESIAEVPPSRHAWADVLACPMAGCGRQFMFTRRKADA